MKIAIISNIYPPYQRGGAEIIAQRMAQEYLRQGHEVLVITTHPWGAQKSYKPVVEQEGKLSVYRYAVPNLYFYTDDYKHPVLLRFFWHAFDLVNLFSARTCKQILQKEQPDLVITHNLMGMSYLIPRVIRILSLKQIHILHDIQLAVRSGLMQLGEEKKVQSLLSKLYQLAVKHLFGSPACVISPSDYLRQFYQQLGYFTKSHFVTQRNPIPEHFYRPQKEKGSQKQAVTLGYIGQLEEHKGLRVLQEAFSLVGDQEVTLELVGAGSLDLQDWAKKDKRVLLKGRIENQALAGWYAGIDAIILPTLVYENSPTVIYEAFASGLPVIVSAIGGAAELVKSPSFGCKVLPGNAKDLARAIEEMLKKIRHNEYVSETIQASVQMLDVKTYCEDLLAL